MKIIAALLSIFLLPVPALPQSPGHPTPPIAPSTCVELRNQEFHIEGENAHLYTYILMNNCDRDQTVLVAIGRGDKAFRVETFTVTKGTTVDTGLVNELSHHPYEVKTFSCMAPFKALDAGKKTPTWLSTDVACY